MCCRNLREALTSTSGRVLHSRAFGVFYTLIQSGGGERVSFGPHEEHHGALCGPSLAVEQSQALALDLVLMKLIDAVVDEGRGGLLVRNCHLEFVFKFNAMILSSGKRFIFEECIHFYLATVKHFILLGVVKGLVSFLFGLGIIL